MSDYLKGIYTRLKTRGWGPAAGTNERIYAGIIGKQGGSEFPVWVSDYDDYEHGTDVEYVFGDVWEGDKASGSNVKHPALSDGANDPERRYIDLSSVDYVYLRKHSYEGGSPGGGTVSGKDDFWGMDEAEVILYADKNDSPNKRIFQKWGNIALGNEYGLTVFLPERSSEQI